MVIVNGELKKMWKEEIVTYFEILPRYLTALSEENHENLNQEIGPWAENRKPDSGLSISASPSCDCS
jgi:hypothetical protein